MCDGVTGLAGCCTSTSARRKRDRVNAPYSFAVAIAALDDVRNWLGLGPGGPRKRMKIAAIGQNGSAGSGEIEISHGAIEAEQLFDPERA